MKKIFLILSLILFLFSCSESQKDESESDDSESNEETQDTTVYNITGKPEKGKCYQDGTVRVQSLDDGSFSQIGSHFTGNTDEYGYNIPVILDDEYSEIFAEVDCDNELTREVGSYKLNGIVKNSDPIKNINPLTKIRSPVARWLFANDFGTTAECLIEAERLILNYLDMPVIENRFTSMSIENDSTHDAVLLLTSSMILYNRTDYEQGDYMIQIANAIKNSDDSLKPEILNTYSQLPLFEIFNNLKASYGINTGLPPVWNLGHHPTYYGDLIQNEHVLQGSFNLSDSMGCSADADFTSYAIPFIFDTWIKTSKYLALNLVGNISIWTRVFNEYDRPGEKIIDIQTLDLDLEGPIDLMFSGLLGGNIESGTGVYIRIERDEPFRLTTSCNGGFLPFGRKLMSRDGGENWYGHDNNTPWNRLSGVMAYGLN